MIKETTYNRQAFLLSFRNGLRPDDPIEVADFAEKYIHLPEGSGEAGLINLDRTPYMRRPLNCLTPGNGITKIVMIACVQIGKSNMGIIFALSMMKISPGNTMIVLPRIGDAEDFSTERVTPMIKASPVLSSLINLSSKSQENKVSKKTYKGGFIYFAGGNSAASFRSKPIRYLYIDEIDEMPRDLEGQGSPVSLGENRTTTFPYSKKIVLTSTPTNEDSLINHEFLKGTQEEYYCPCPHCGGFQTFNFKKGLKYETLRGENNKVISESVYYECEFNQCQIYELNKQDMMIKGKWQEHNPEGEFPSFRINILYSPWKKWHEVVQKYLEALKDRAEMKTFINTYLGEVFIEDNTGVDVDDLIKRGKKGLPQLELDPRIIALTGAVDVQDNRLVIDIKGWGCREECWTILYKEIHGDLNKDEVWDQIRDLVNKPYRHPSGIDLYIRYCAMDQGGHYGQKVADFCSKNLKFKMIRGNPRKQKTLLSAPSKQDIIYKGTFKKKGVELYWIGTELAKEEIFFRMKIEKSGPMYIHFNKDLEPRFFDMLTSERYVTTYKDGKATQSWKIIKGKRNEPVDTFVYNFAIARGLCHIDLLDEFTYEKEYKQMFGDFGVNFVNSQKTQEEINKEENEKKIEIIKTLQKSKKSNSFAKSGFMSGNR